MNLNKLAVVFLILALLAPGTVLAANTVLSGIFDGTEEKTEPLPGTCLTEQPLGYQDTGTFQVSLSGAYLVFDAFNLNGADVSALIYQGPFNVNNPLANLVTLNGVDYSREVNLEAGVDYSLVVQNYCNNVEGAWSVTFSGPSNVTSNSTRLVPDMTQGVFTNDAPRATTDCGADAPYQSTGAVQLATTGTYYHTDILVDQGYDICLGVYTEPFDPANAQNNRVGELLDDSGTVTLSAGQDYYFVVHVNANWTEFVGDYFYVLAPPAPFRINKSLAGAWFNFETSGQGFFLDVYENSNQMFLAWFTFDLTRPDAGVPSGVGEPGQRWMTALGNYTENVADLAIYWAEGMVFDSPTPAVTQTADGTMRVEFTSCTEGTVEYDLGTADRTGTVPIEPLAPDLVELCDSLVDVPGMPGLL